MANFKKTDNLVKRVFDREAASQEKISGLFTHFKPPGRVVSPKKQQLHASSHDHFIGIEISPTSVKWVHLARTAGNALQLADLDQEPFGVFPGRNRMDVEREALRKLISRHSEKGVLSISVGSKEVAYSNFTFPVMPSEELRSALGWKLKQLKPFGAIESELVFRPVVWDQQRDLSGKQGSMKTLVVAAPINLIEHKLSFLKEFGIYPNIVLPTPNSMAHLQLQKSYGTAAGEVVLWLDLGAEESFMTVMRDGLCCFVRNLSVTSSQMTRQIAQFLQVEEREAEELKRTYGVQAVGAEVQAGAASGGGFGLVQQPADFEDAAKKNRQALASILENLVIDIEHSFKHFSYQVSQSAISSFSRVYLVGGGALLKNIDLYLAERLGVPVERVDPFAGVKVSEALMSSKPELLKQSAQFATACALALSGYHPKEQRCNLLAQAEDRPRVNLFDTAKKKPKAAILLATLVLGLALLPPFWMNKVSEYRVEKAQEELKAAKKEKGKFQFDKLKGAEVEKDFQIKREALMARRASLGRSVQGEGRLSEALNQMAKMMPEGMWVRSLSYTGNEIRIEGVSPSTQSILKFIDELKAEKQYFLNPVFDYAQKEKTPEFDFQLKVILVGHADEKS